MYGIFTYIWVILRANVGIHIPYMEHIWATHGASGIYLL